VHGVLAGCTPLALSTWHGRTGLSVLPPLSLGWSEQTWADRVLVDLTELRIYARGVYSARWTDFQEPQRELRASRNPRTRLWLGMTSIIWLICLVMSAPLGCSAASSWTSSIRSDDDRKCLYFFPRRPRGDKSSRSWRQARFLSGPSDNSRAGPSADVNNSPLAYLSHSTECAPGR
jgi:hypothetical protein